MDTRIGHQCRKPGKLKRAWWGPVRESPPEGESGQYGIINGFLMTCVAVLIFPLVIIFFWFCREKKTEFDLNE